MLPAAPGRLSTITGWPHFSVSFSATMRGIRSALPPAGNGTTMRTGLAGHSCAWSALAKSASAAAARSLMRSTETPKHSNARDVVDVDAVVRVAPDPAVALPVAAQAQVAHAEEAREIPLQPTAIGDVAVARRVDPARRSVKGSVISAEAQVSRYLLVDRQNAERGDVPDRGVNGLSGRSGTGGRYLAQVPVGDFGGEMAKEPVAAEYAKREVGVIAAASAAGEDAKATLFRLRIAERAADIRPLHARRRRRRELGRLRERGCCAEQNCEGEKPGHDNALHTTQELRT